MSEIGVNGIVLFLYISLISQFSECIMCEYAWVIGYKLLMDFQSLQTVKDQLGRIQEEFQFHLNTTSEVLCVS